MEISRQDIVVVALFVYMSCTNKSHGDDVSVMLFSGVNLLFAGYFLLRLLFQWGGVKAKNLVLISLESATCYEAVLGFLQIVGVADSNNYLFSCTGTFDNPGTLGGFLAIGLCVSLAEIFLIKRMNYTEKLMAFLIMPVCKQYNKLYQFSPPKLYRFSPITVPSLATKRTTVIYWKQ